MAIEEVGRLDEGDASVHLEELLVGQLPEMEAVPHSGQTVQVELVGPYLRVSGGVNIGQFRRASDYLNNHDGLMALRQATVLRRDGQPTRVRAESIWVAPQELSLVGLHEPPAAAADPGLHIAKVSIPLIVVTPGHTLTGEVHLAPEAELDAFIVSPSPAFVPMTDVRTRSLADRRVQSLFPVALINRRHIVAITRLLPGMLRSGVVL